MSEAFRAGSDASAQDDAERPGSRLRPLTVSELNDAADALLRRSLGPLWIAGEVSRFVSHKSGHWYFTLKDDGAAISCAMFRGRNRSVRFDVTDGLELLALAVPGVYGPIGRYQLIVETLEPRGRGAAALALEQLKAKLAAEGLFDPERKQELPLLPRRIGVATSVDGAALRDVLRVLERRFAGVSVLVGPTVVQGSLAPDSIARSLALLDGRGLDVLLIVRGGGSREDLAAFDDERVVRAIVACRTPIVSGIGHEIDTSLADLAADRRAPTPSAAAEIVVRERRELRSRVASLERALGQSSRNLLHALRTRLLRARGSRGLGAVPLRLQRARMHAAELTRSLERVATAAVRSDRDRLARAVRRLSPENLQFRIADRRHRLDAMGNRLATAARNRLHGIRSSLARAVARLEALSPLAVIERGYALVTRELPEGTLIDDAGALTAGDRLYVRLARGGAKVIVERVVITGERNEP